MSARPSPSSPVGFLVWITGLAGSGKTTLGRALNSALAERNIRTVILDGDELREITGGVFGYDLDSRRQCAEFYSRLCRTLTHQGINVICCTISMFESVRELNRSSNESYFEIFLDAPMGLLKTRNQKKLYDNPGGDSKNVMGLDLNLELPTRSDLTFNAADTSSTIERMTETAILKLLDRGMK